MTTMINCLRSWPEPIVRVQHLADSGIKVIPDRYVKKLSDRPISPPAASEVDVNIPVIDMQDVYSTNVEKRRATMERIDQVCKEWGFFQVVNHGVNEELMKGVRECWREFFRMPLEERQKYANDPNTYEGYGSRLGVEKGVKLDWSDYYFLRLFPENITDFNKWPRNPVACRALVEEYGKQVMKLGGELLNIFSENLGLGENYLLNAFGGEKSIDAGMRVNYYPKCPQPDLTLGLSPHSDPGGVTILYPDENVCGLQVHRGDDWITVKPVPNAFIINIGDQLEVLSNAKYKSIEHRVIVNSAKERVSVAVFYSPNGDALIKPAEGLLGDEPPLYSAMTFNEYRVYIRTRGPSGKSLVESLKSPK